ncbi:uncharacterized protein LOC144623517 [Crassostrea virginica]
MDGIYVVFCCLVGGFVLNRVSSYENLAFNKSTWRQGGLYGSNHAVDGQKSSLSVWGQDCVPQDLTQTAEWRVDLGEILSVHHILIQYATNNEAWDANNSFTAFFWGFSVYLSNTTNKKEGVLCFKDTIYSRATIPNPVQISCPHHGRYVIYYNNRTHPPYPEGYSRSTAGALCEVEVYGCPEQWLNGEICSIPCPMNCLWGHCHMRKRTCVGCTIGFTGPTCQKNQIIPTEQSQTQTNVPENSKEQKQTRAPNGMEDNSSDKKDLVVLIVVYVAGVLVSVAAVVIIVACVIVFKRKRAKMKIIEKGDRNRQAARTLEFVSTIENEEQLLLSNRHFTSNGTYNPEFEMNTLPRPHIINEIDSLSATVIHDIRDYDNNDRNIVHSLHNYLEENSFDIQVTELLNRIEKLEKDNDQGFKTEFAWLPSGELHTCFVGKHKDNLAKNRYKTTFPC